MNNKLNFLYQVTISKTYLSCQKYQMRVSNMASDKSESKNLPELMAEKDSIDPSFSHALRLISKEIEEIKNPDKDGKKTADKLKEMVNVYSPKLPKVECMLQVPTQEFPGVNFVGRIIGPGGATLRGIQEVTNTRIAVLGKGSQRDKKKAEELAASGDPKWAHMKLPLHVRITAIGPIDQAYACVGRACTEVMKLMTVEEDELMDPNMMANQQAAIGGGRGSGRGMQRGRGAAGGRGAPRGRGAPGAGVPRSGRGATRGATRGANASMVRGARGAARGGAGRGFAQPKPTAMVQAADPYTQQGADETYGYEGYGAEQQAMYGQDQTGMYGAEYMDQSYEAAGTGQEAYCYGQEAYTADALLYAVGCMGQKAIIAQWACFTRFLPDRLCEAGKYAKCGYGGPEQGYEAYGGYDSYGNGAADTTVQYSTQNKPYRGKMMRGGARGRGAAKPY